MPDPKTAPWVCDKCQSHNSSSNTSCAACGDERTAEDKPAKKPTVEEARLDLDVALDELCDLFAIWASYNEKEGDTMARNGPALAAGDLFVTTGPKLQYARYLRLAIVEACRDAVAIADFVSKEVALGSAKALFQELIRMTERPAPEAPPPSGEAPPADSPPAAQKEVAPGQEPGSPPSEHL
jgi:hypothetical protein